MPELNIIIVDKNGTFDDAISEASPKVKEIAYALRALLADVMPGITEVAWSHQKNIGYGVGAKKMSEHFCYIMPLKHYVNLGFMYGADLDDPEHLLVGTGKALRHIKIHSVEETRNPAIRKLVELASQHLPKLK